MTLRLSTPVPFGEDNRQPVSTPLFRSRGVTLSTKEVGQMLKQHGFFAKSYDWNSGYDNPQGKGFANQYQLSADKKVVYDRAGGLTWQQSGSKGYVDHEGAKQYIAQLNRERFAGYGDWRLPTLEEAMSLMEPSELNGDLYIDPVFDKTQRWIWTADQESASRAWYVYFDYGGCYHNHIVVDGYVRAVRSGP